MLISDLIAKLEFLKEKFGDQTVKYENFCAMKGQQFLEVAACNLYTDERLPAHEQTCVVLQ